MELFEPLVQDCPLLYISPNAPSKQDVLETMLLSILAGHRRYAHVTTIRSDQVNPEMLGMKKVLSEDSVRRAFSKTKPEECKKWQQEFELIKTGETVKRYEYGVVVTSLKDGILSIAQFYRDRADAENAFDELKNQWSWGGFTIQDLHCCQIMARNTALIYNGWSIFARLAIPEAITSRPLLMEAVGRKTTHSGQTRLILTSAHGNRCALKRIMGRLSHFFEWLRIIAEQLNGAERWRQILSRALLKFLRGRVLAPPPLLLEIKNQKKIKISYYPGRRYKGKLQNL